LTRFLYLYGRISKDLELTGSQTGSAEAANQARSGLIENVRAMRDRLDQLEGQFRFTQGLERQYQTLQGVSARADQATQQVSAGRYDQAGRTLVEISSQLTDVLSKCRRGSGRRGQRLKGERVKTRRVPAVFTLSPFDLFPSYPFL
jgi:hypothetical protein